MTDTNNKTNDFELDLDTPTTSEFMTYYSEKANMVYKYSDADSLLEHPEILVSMINHHRQNQVPRLHSLDHYYKAENDTIMNRPARKEAGKADYRIANNFGKVISSFMVGYMGGNPIQVQDKKDDKVQNVITEANDANNADEENSNLLLDLSKYGRAYEILWRDEQDNNRFALSSVFDTFVIYDTTIEEKPIMAVRYPSLGFETDGRTMCQPIVYTADKEGYTSFVIPDNVGGRFSVLTPVGLLPIACAGFDIDELVEGARDIEKSTGADVPFEENISEQYAAIRNALYSKGKKVEILADFQPKLHYIAEWWKQLYGESEGKDNKGIFPASVDFTTDLHSMGQWIQEGERSIFETVLSVEETNHRVLFPHDEENLDGLNFLEGRRVDEVNKMAELGTRLAHVDGGVPNIRVIVPKLSERYIGQLIYFFERACGISGNILGVNAFNQPGVEAYKKNMFALLNKPGYEKESEAIRARIAE